MAPKKRTSEAIPSTTSTPLISSTSTTSTPSNTSTTPVTAKLRSTRQGGQSAQEIAVGIWDNYVEKTPQRTKLIDVFMAFLVGVGVLQFVYCVLVGNYPFNAFLSGFSATVGQFVLTASLRIQTNPENKSEFYSVSPERAFADYIFGSMILHFFCVNFIN